MKRSAAQSVILKNVGREPHGQRLGDFAGRLDPAELMEINVALRAVLDLE